MGTTHVMHRHLRHTPPVAVRGQGVWLEDAAGRRYIDASGGAAVSCLGHGHPDVLAAMHRQIDQLAYAHTSFFTTEVAEQLAEQLVRTAPAGMSHAYFVSGGSEAVEAALKMARQYYLEIGQPERSHFIARQQQVAAINGHIAIVHFRLPTQRLGGLVHDHARARYQIGVDVSHFFHQHAVISTRYKQPPTVPSGMGNAHNHHRYARVVAGEIGPLKRGVGKGNLAASAKNQRPQNRYLLALANRIGGHKRSGGLGFSAIISGFHEPARHEVQRFPVFGSLGKNGF